MDVGGGDTETRAVLAGAAAEAVGGAERKPVLAGVAGLEAGTRALGGALWDKSRLRPSPTAMEKRIVRTVPNGVSIAPIKFLAQSILLFTVIVIGGGSVPSYFFCAPSIAASALFTAASALLLATTAAMTAAAALTAAIIAARLAADS
jgi:hypothetical protein